MNQAKKTTDYEGGQVITFPQQILSECADYANINHLYINRVGVFPHAVGHYTSREKGKVSYAVLLHCYDGEGWITLGNKKIILKSGDVYIIPPLLAHSYGASEKKPWSIYWMHISGAGVKDLADVFEDLSGGTAMHTLYSEERTQLFYKILNTLSKGFSRSNLFYANMILPHYLATFIAQDRHNAEIELPAETNNNIDEIISYMQKNVSEKLTIEEMAVHLAMSSSSFFKKFKENTGYSPVAYFNFLKIQKAIQLMHNQTYNISEVGAKIGIDDAYYFSRLFKKQMGVSPRQYIKDFVSKSKG